MKKVILSVLAFVLIVNASNSQTEDVNYTQKGTYIVGGSSDLSFAFGKTKLEYNGQDDDNPSKLFNLAFSPAAGYFVMDNLAIGLQIPISYSKYKNEIQGFEDIRTVEQTATSITGAPFVRYYFKTSKINPYIQGTVGFGSSKTKYTGYEPEDSESTSNIFLYGFDGGVAIFLNSIVSIDLGLGYASSTSKPDDSSSNSDIKFTTNAFGFNAGISIFL